MIQSLDVYIGDPNDSLFRIKYECMTQFVSIRAIDNKEGKDRTMFFTLDEARILARVLQSLT